MQNQRLVERQEGLSIKEPPSLLRNNHVSRRPSRESEESSSTTTQSRQLRHTQSVVAQPYRFSLRSPLPVGEKSMTKNETCSASTTSISPACRNDKIKNESVGGVKQTLQNGRSNNCNNNVPVVSSDRTLNADCSNSNASSIDQSSAQVQDFKIPNISKESRSRSVDPPSLRGQDQYTRSFVRPASPSHPSDINSDNFNTAEPSHRSEHHSGDDSKDISDKRHHTRLNFLNLFRRQKPVKQNQMKVDRKSDLLASEENITGSVDSSNLTNINKEDHSYFYRELPPPPPGHSDSGSDEDACTNPIEFRDFAASIEKVKDCGWYWGPLSSEAAEELLRTEPDGSFIVRDSSDARYIFSLTFKLHGLVRHVRIEHDQGNFSFGPLTRFKASTIVDFVENAVAHSRSGRYLFFLHRRPVLGPMQVQLLHPYSRFMHSRSLKHMCRFVILKYVRRDLIHTLPLPKPLQDYLNTPHYYFEQP